MTSSSASYIINPLGDLLLILRNPNAPFAVLPGIKPSSRKAQVLSPVLLTDAKQSGAAAAPVPEKVEIRMQLSSRHLTSASGYFSRLAAGQWREAKVDEDSADAAMYSYVVTTEDWDQQALLILMKIIHARTTTLPTKVTLELLAKICVLADYYQCNETVEFFVKMWSLNLAEPLPTQYERDVFLRLVVCCLDGNADILDKMTQVIIYESEQTFEPFSLPIPDKIIAAINKRREDLIFSLLSGIQDLADEFYDERSNACSFECKAINLGTLLKAQRKLGILDSRPEPPFDGWSVTTLVQAMRGIQVPFPNESRPTRYFCNNAYQTQRFTQTEYAPVCRISVKITQIIDQYVGPNCPSASSP